MPRKLFLVLITAVGLAIGGCVSSADDTPNVVGGYSEVSVRDPGVNEAAQFAVAAREAETGSAIELSQVIEAEQQVVAGMNYRLYIGVIEGGQSGTADVEVYRDPQGNYSLTSWIWEQNPETS
ncbi:MAG: cystatin family protein [Pseudomonadota bacterium]